MAYAAQVVQILIASPGDVQAERQIISDLIYEWNYTNSRERSIVLLPIRWETHAAPEMGDRPQAVKNRQVVDACDMAVAVFWTRLGTPTGEAESGTAEEITRMGNAGKPVMIYFSDAAIRPGTLDIPEYQRLKDFQGQTYPRGLVDTYSTIDQFRDKFRRQLASQISSIITVDAQKQDASTVDTLGITLGFASAETFGTPSLIDNLELTKIICPDKSEVPDYEEELEIASDDLGRITTPPNPRFYRLVVDYAERVSLLHMLRLALSGTSRSVRDIHLDIRVYARTGRVLINPIRPSWPSAHGSSITTSFNITQTPEQVSVQSIAENEWYFQADVPVVQAQRTVYLTGPFTVAATEDFVLVFDTTVYTTDALPFALRAELRIDIKAHEMNYREILREMVPDYGDRDISSSADQDIIIVNGPQDTGSNTSRRKSV